VDQREAPLLDALTTIERKPLHGFGAPGHHQGAGASKALLRLIGRRAFAADVITPKGLDDRTEGGHALQRAHEIAAEAWNADFCRFVTGGSTQSLHTAIAAVAGPGDTVLFAGNVHKAERSYALAAGMEAVIVPAIVDAARDVEHGVAPESLAAALEAHPGAKAFVLVSPTYYGVTSDVATLADLCHRRGVPLICDAAWGGAFAFSQRLPHDPLTKGADIAVYSLHKTMGALTQGSALLAKGDRIDRQRLWMAYELFETTSPSVPILASLDAVRRDHAIDGEKIWGAVLDRADDLRGRLARIDGLSLLGEADLPPGAEFDRSKLLIDCAALGVSAYAIDDWLVAEHRVGVALSDARHLLAIVSPGTTARDVRALARGLRDCVRRLRAGTLALPPAPALPGIAELTVEMAMPGPAAFFAPAEHVPIAASVGRIAAEMIAPAPPGVPRLVPGQRIGRAHAAWLSASHDAGAFFLDPTDPTERTVRVVA
jgi:arginine/lysine/ornithine decarboxylase